MTEGNQLDQLLEKSVILKDDQLDQKITDLEKEMLLKSKEMNFEEAIKIRNQLRELKKIRLLS